MLVLNGIVLVCIDVVVLVILLFVLFFSFRVISVVVNLILLSWLFMMVLNNVVVCENDKFCFVNNWFNWVWVVVFMLFFYCMCVVKNLMFCCNSNVLFGVKIDLGWNW